LAMTSLQLQLKSTCQVQQEKKRDQREMSRKYVGGRHQQTRQRVHGKRQKRPDLAQPAQNIHALQPRCGELCGGYS
jgi:hypothetical protein